MIYLLKKQGWFTKQDAGIKQRDKIGEHIWM